MWILIGSQAAKYHGLRFNRPTDNHEYDFMGTKEDQEKFIEELKLDNRVSNIDVKESQSYPGKFNIKFLADNIDYLVPGIVTLLVPALQSVITATYAWTAALLANPITWIVLGIAALGAAIVAVIKNWDAIVAIMELAWKQFTKIVSIIWDGLVSAFNYLIKVIKEVIVFWLNWLNPIGLLYNAIKALIPGLFDLSGVFEVS